MIFVVWEFGRCFNFKELLGEGTWPGVMVELRDIGINLNEILA